MAAFTVEGKTVDQLMSDDAKAKKKAAIRAEGDAAVKRILGKGPKKAIAAQDAKTAQDAAGIAGRKEYTKKLGNE